MVSVEKTLWEESKAEAGKKFGDNSAYKHIYAAKLFRRKMQEKLRADAYTGKSLKDIAAKHNVRLKDIFAEFQLGIQIELENIDDIETAREVAKDHLIEHPNYYTVLKSRTVVEKPLDENTAESTFNPHEMDKMASFRLRVEYCSRFLQKIGNGSSRIVFQYNDRSVIKLAKNQKGIEQNSFEADVNSPIVTKVFDHDKLCTWIQSEMAKKINKARFKQLCGFDIDTVRRFLLNYYNESNSKKPLFTLDQNLVTELYESEFIQDLIELMSGYDINAGDLGRISSYGELNGHLVVIDYGGSNEIISNYYHRMEEAIKTANLLYKKDLIEDKVATHPTIRHWIRNNWQHINK
jgi:hypothetical protein